MQLNTNISSKWEQEYTVTLTLLELQQLYDSVGVTSLTGLRESYSNRDETMPYSDVDCLYDDLEYIIESLGGYVD